MNALTMSVEIKADRHLVIDLPPDMPIGRAELTIKVAPEPHDPPDPTLLRQPLDRETARAMRLAAGALSKVHYELDDVVELSDEESEELWSKFSGGTSVDVMIDL